MEPAWDIVAAKRALRRERLERRAAAAGEAPGAGERLAELFLDALALPARSVVAGYWPIRDEIDPRPLMRRLHAAGHACALCVLGARAAPLAFRAWAPGMALQPGGFGTQAPPADSPELAPDIVLTPLLAFDDHGHRLGYGGGYYDRTLARLRAGGRVLAVGAAFESQRVESVPHTDRDGRLDWVITEQQARQIA